MHRLDGLDFRRPAARIAQIVIKRQESAHAPIRVRCSLRCSPRCSRPRRCTAGASRLSGPHDHDGRAVPGWRPDRHHRAHPCGRAASNRSARTSIIDNRAGAGGNLGIAYVARAKPDGYTLLFTSTAIAVNPALFANLPYDPIKDFAPISELVNAPNVLFVRPDSGMQLDRGSGRQGEGRAEHDELRLARASAPSRISPANCLKLRAGIDIQHIPYRGGGPATQALVSGTVQLASVALAPVEPLIKSGTVRALAVTGATALVSRCPTFRP